MEKLLNEEMETQIKEMFNHLDEEVIITLFNEENNQGSELTTILLKEISSLSNKIKLEVKDFNKENEFVKNNNIYSAPSFYVSKNDKVSNGIFYGVPAGHEINTLLSNIIDTSTKNDLYEKEILNNINKINKETNIKVFVTTQCPHCPGAAINALRLASLNSNVKAEVYEVHSNMEIANKYKVQGVPKIVINETNDLVGNQPIEEFLKVINK